MRGYIVDILAGKDVPPPLVHKESAVDPAALADYPAAYELSPTSSLIITREGDQLFAEAPGAWRMPIFAEGGDRFFAKALEIQVQFVRSGRGQVTSMIVIQPDAGDRLAVRK